MSRERLESFVTFLVSGTVHASMALYDLWEAPRLIWADWRSVLQDAGEQCVEMTLIPWMLR